MVEPLPAPAPPPSPGAGALAFERARRRLVFACVVIAGGLAASASFDRTTGGVVLLVGWALGIASLHQLGRGGAERSGPNSSDSGTRG